MTVDLEALKKIISNRGECAGPLTTFKHGVSGLLTHVSIVCSDNWVEVIEWLVAMNHIVPLLIAEHEARLEVATAALAWRAAKESEAPAAVKIAAIHDLIDALNNLTTASRT